MQLMKCMNLSLSYEGHLVIDKLSFEIDSGDYMFVVGENGSGKSTLVKGLLGLKSPSDGEIVKPTELTKNDIGYLPQQTAAQKDFPASVFEVVISGRLSSLGKRPFYSKKDKEIAKDNMRELNIEDLSKKCYRELSGGQQQRVLLARALCASKKLLFLDEPTSGLDPVAREELYKSIYQINRDREIAIVMVSHDIRNAVKYGTKILHLSSDKTFFGTKEEYAKSEIASYFLGEGAINV